MQWVPSEKKEQPEQEPVAFRNKQTGEFCTSGFLRGQLGQWTPLYDHPYELLCVCGAAWEGDTIVETPNKREWVGLTDEEMRALKQKSVDDGMTRIVSDFEYIRSIETKLREKNGC